MSKTAVKFLISLILLCMTLLVQNSHADQKSDAARLESIQLLSERDNQAALKQLKDFYANLPAEADYQIRVDALFELSRLYDDAGDLAQSETTAATIKQIAERQNDAETLALLKMNEVYSLRDSG